MKVGSRISEVKRIEVDRIMWKLVTDVPCSRN